MTAQTLTRTSRRRALPLNSPKLAEWRAACDELEAFYQANYSLPVTEAFEARVRELEAAQSSAWMRAHRS